MTESIGIRELPRKREVLWRRDAHAAPRIRIRPPPLSREALVVEQTGASPASRRADRHTEGDAEGRVAFDPGVLLTLTGRATKMASPATVADARHVTDANLRRVEHVTSLEYDPTNFVHDDSRYVYEAHARAPRARRGARSGA